MYPTCANLKDAITRAENTLLLIPEEHRSVALEALHTVINTVKAPTPNLTDGEIAAQLPEAIHEFGPEQALIFLRSTLPNTAACSWKLQNIPLVGTDYFMGITMALGRLFNLSAQDLSNMVREVEGSLA